MWQRCAATPPAQPSRGSRGLESTRIGTMPKQLKPTPQPLVCGSASIVVIVSSVVVRTIVTAIRIVRTMVAVVAAVSVSAVSSAPIHFPVDARDTERREGPSNSDETGC